MERNMISAILRPYRLAIILACLLAISDIAFGGYILKSNATYVNGVAIHIGLALSVALGLWLQSKAIRYFGGVCFILTAGSAIWPLLTQDFALGPGTAWVVVMGLLSVALAYLLLLSKQFSHEFNSRLSTRPAYKRTMLKWFIILAAATAILATFKDIYNLTNPP